MTAAVVIATLAAAFLALYARARLAPVHVRIRRGRHYAGPYTTLLCALKVGCFGPRDITVTFDASAATYAEPGDYQGAWNKAFGRTHGFLNTPRSHSTRWMWHRDEAGERVVVQVREEEDRVQRGDNIFAVEPSSPLQLAVMFTGWPCVPYFGGKHPAPVEVRFTLC